MDKLFFRDTFDKSRADHIVLYAVRPTGTLSPIGEFSIEKDKEELEEVLLELQETFPREEVVYEPFLEKKTPVFHSKYGNMVDYQAVYYDVRGMGLIVDFAVRKEDA